MAAPEILEVTLTGNNIDDLRTILDKLVKGYVDDATTLDRKPRDDEIAGLDKTRLAVQAEIELQEKAIDLLDDEARRADYRTRLVLYEAGRPARVTGGEG